MDLPGIYDSTTIQHADPFPERLAVIGGGFVGLEFANMFQLFGSTTWFTPAQMADLYGTAEAYRSAFDASLDEAVAAGWVLPEDRDAFAAEARTVAFP